MEGGERGEATVIRTGDSSSPDGRVLNSGTILTTQLNESKGGVMVQVPLLQQIGKHFRGGGKWQTDGEKL